MKETSAPSENGEQVLTEKRGKESETIRKKKKSTMKTAMWRKEKKKWSNFTRGLASDGVSPQKNKSDEGGTHTEGDEDETSKRIRDEAIKTWNLGKQLGISGQGNESGMVDQLVNLEKADLTNCEKGKEKKETVDQ